MITKTLSVFPPSNSAMILAARIVGIALAGKGGRYGTVVQMERAWNF